MTIYSTGRANGWVPGEIARLLTRCLHEPEADIAAAKEAHSDIDGAIEVLDAIEYALSQADAQTLINDASSRVDEAGEAHRRICRPHLSQEIALRIRGARREVERARDRAWTMDARPVAPLAIDDGETMLMSDEEGA